MPKKISVSKGLNYTPAFDTYVPELNENANIQNALELLYYGNSDDGNTIDGTNSLYATLLDFDTRIDANDALFTGHASAIFNVHGTIAGSRVVGTIDTMTLENKTINLTNNTLTGTIAQFNTALSDADFATTTTSQALSNKTLTSPVITGGTINSGVALTVDSTELNKLDGVTTTTAQLNYINTTTSDVQSQINTKAPLASPTFTGTVTLPTFGNGLAPVGMLAPFAGSSAPTGWLLCAGQAVSRTTYSALYTALGGASSPYGLGDGSTTFNVPDLRGRVPAGVDNMNGTDAGRLDLANTLGTTTGAQNVTLTAAQTGVPAHDHGVTSVGGGGHTASGSIAVNNHNHTYGVASDGTNSHDHAVNSGTVNYAAAQSDGGTANVFNLATSTAGNMGGSASVSVADHGHTIDIALNTAVAATAHNNMQPTILLNYIIKF